MEALLIERGYRCGTRERNALARDKRIQANFDRQPQRHTYRKGEIAVMTESNDRPFWTVQQFVGPSIAWFVDFGLDVPPLSVFHFIESLSLGGEA